MKLTKIFGIVLSLHVGVILLVMFQPGCQTVQKKNATTEPTSNVEEVDTKKTSSGFNSGLDPEPEIVAEKPKMVEFSSPTRPDAGGLIVPGQGAIEAKPLPPILGDSGPIVSAVNLRPSGLSIYKVERGDTLWGIARKKGVTLSSLLGSNPNLDKNGKLSIGQEIMVPEEVQSGTPLVDADARIEPSSGATYIVQKGDSLSRIARTQKVSLNDLMEVNGLTKFSIIKIGQVLNLPAEGLSQDSSTSFVESVSPVVPDGASTHIVQKGDNLTRIAAIYGTSIKQIMEWNELADASRIRVGQSLIVSGSQAVTPEPTIDSLLGPEISVPIQQDQSSVEGFFKGATDERPIIDVSEGNP